MNKERQREIMTEEIWLNYFNNYLFEKQVVTEDERNKMKNQISSSCDRKRKSLRMAR